MDSELVFEHPPWVKVFVDRGTQSAPGYIRIRESDGASGAVILLRHVDSFAMVRVFRHALGREVWELPRGFGEPQESPEETAARELEEEVGLALSPDNLTLLGVVSPNSGILESQVSVFQASLPEAVDLRTKDSAEVRATAWVSRGDLRGFILNGEVMDGFTLAALMLSDLSGPTPT